MSASTPLLDVTAIETFYGPIQAIRGVSLQVAQSQIITVLGANGAGKTTVLRTISGVLDPERGQVRFENREIGHLLRVSEKTVKTHVSSVLAKLGVADRTQAALVAVRHSGR